MDDLFFPEYHAPDSLETTRNDTIETAELKGEGTYEVSGLGQDWYELQVQAGFLDITLTPGDEPLNLDIALYDSDGVRIQRAPEPSGEETITRRISTADTYFLRVYAAPLGDNPASDTPLDYTLTLDFPQVVADDNNDTFATAIQIGEGETGPILGTGIDWWKVTSHVGELNVTMTTSENLDDPDDFRDDIRNLNVSIYNSEGEHVRSNFSTDTVENVSYDAMEAGDYYIKVYTAQFGETTPAPDNVVLSYSLNVDLPEEGSALSKTWSKELDFGPIRNASVSVYDIDNDGNDEIFVGAVKALDEDGNEVLPGGLIALEDNGDVKWSQTFPGISGPDPVTGLTYTSSSVTTAPVFSDLNNDGSIDIVVGVGADNRGEFGTAGQPGDMGGIYALDRDGNILWSHITEDTFGLAAPAGQSGGPDGRPDGVYGTPRVFDIDADGQREVLFTSWDHYLYVLNGKDGTVEYRVDLHDTAGVTPAIADLDLDGLFEIIVPADISQNAAAGLPTQGGILHVLNNYGHQTVDGWDEQVGTSTSAEFRGKFEEQSLWSDPTVFDLDNDGKLEIIQGTGNFFQDDRGEYVKVWDTDGTLLHELETEGRVLAGTLVVDLDGAGGSEIIAATLEGYIHAWTASGEEIFSTQVLPYDLATGTGLTDVPIARQPIAVDLTGDGNLEILVSIGSQMVVLDKDGNQITNTDGAERAFNNYAGSPVAHDIDNDGYIDLISGGTNAAQEYAVVHRFENIVDTQFAEETRIGAYQNNQSLNEIQEFVQQLYTNILGRDADPQGENNWTDRLYTGVASGSDVARGFIFSAEFANQNTTNEEYVTVLYKAFFGVDTPDTGGFNRWTGDLENGLSRLEVLEGFTGSPQFSHLASAFGIRAENKFGAVESGDVLIGDEGDSDVLRAGSGDNILKEGTGAVDDVLADNVELTGQVFRLYGGTLGREPDSNGFEGWYNGIVGGITLLDAANAFVNSAEFQANYGTLSDEAFVSQLYHNVLDRAPDTAGLDRWTGDLADGVSRAEVVLGFIQGAEYRAATDPELDQWMRNAKVEWNDVLEGGAGDDQMNGGMGSDVFVFRNGQTGSDTIHNFEPWDVLQLSGFGFDTKADAMANMSQTGSSVVFSKAGQQITFVNTSMADMYRVSFNVS